MLGPVHKWAQNRLILAIFLPLLTYRSFPCFSWNPLFAPALLLGQYLHCPPCLECEEAEQVRKELTQAFKCANCFTDCFIDCKEAVLGLARVTSPLPACGFSVSSTPLAGTWAVQHFLEWLCAGWWRTVPGGAWEKRSWPFWKETTAFFWRTSWQRWCQEAMTLPVAGLPPWAFSHHPVSSCPVPPLHILLLPEHLSWGHPSLTSKEARTPWQARSGCHDHTIMTSPVGKISVGSFL